MATLKSLKLRIASVKSTQKITKAMKMVAAAKLRRAQEAAEAGRPYASRIEAVVASLGARITPGPQTSKMLTGSGKEETYLLVVCTSDRGLAGAFNANIVKAARQRAQALIAAGKTVKFYLVGKKGGAVIRRLFPGTIIASTEFAGVKQIAFEHAAPIADDIAARYEAGEFDVAYMYYAKFQSALVQELLPVPVQAGGGEAAAGVSAAVEYEPDEEGILADLLPRNLSVQIFRALLENAASEQGSRMTAMDNATRNAGDMINRLSIQYNRQRQAAITTELVEIISGAEAL